MNTKYCKSLNYVQLKKLLNLMVIAWVIFHSCWEILKWDIMLTMWNFQSQEFFEKSLNATFVDLIPSHKINGAKELISLDLLVW